MRLAAVFVGFPLVATMLNGLIMGSRHFFLSEWPGHAYHHLARQITLDCGVAVLGLLLLYRFVRGAKEVWLCWALLLVGASIFGGYWLSSILVGLGEPGLLPYSARATYTAIYVLGVALLWREHTTETLSSDV